MGFIGQKTQPTVSKHWRKRGLDWASIPLDPSHCADNYMQYEKQKHKIHTDKHK